jgi:hypothetical protein
MHYVSTPDTEKHGYPEIDSYKKKVQCSIFFSVPLIINYFHSMKDKIRFTKLPHKQNVICVTSKQRKKCVEVMHNTKSHRAILWLY